MPGRHPDDDQLADLAADVLPVDQARAVEAHVLACDRCASLLSDAERVRGLLLADDAGPVPPEIWSRIEAALQAASPTSTSPTSPTSSSPPVLGERAPPPPPPAPVEQRVDAAGPGSWDGPDPLDDPDDWTTAARPVAASRSRSGPGIPTGSVRRLSTPRRGTPPERRRRPAPLLLVAAAAVVLAMAVGAVRLVRSGGDATAALQGGSSAGTASGSAAVGAAGAADAAAGAALTRSNREYTSSTLATGARSLVAALGRGQAGTVTPQGSSTPHAPAARAPPRAGGGPGGPRPRGGLGPRRRRPPARAARRDEPAVGDAGPCCHGRHQPATARRMPGGAGRVPGLRRRRRSRQVPGPRG